MFEFLCNIALQLAGSANPACEPPVLQGPTQGDKAPHRTVRPNAVIETMTSVWARKTFGFL